MKHGAHLTDYDAEHRHPVNRALHMIGIPIIVLSLVALVSPWRPFELSRAMALGVFVGGWALLFLGHAIEGNRPAVLKHPTAVLKAVAWWVRRILPRRRL